MHIKRYDFPEMSFSHKLGKFSDKNQKFSDVWNRKIREDDLEGVVGREKTVFVFLAAFSTKIGRCKKTGGSRKSC